MVNSLTLSPDRINNIIPIRSIRDEDRAPYDVGETSPTREWRPMIPPDLLCPEIGTNGIAVYAALCTYADRQTGECWPAHSTIAERLGISRKLVLNTIKILEQHGFVEVRKLIGRKHIYRLPHQAKQDVSQNDTPPVSKTHTSCDDTLQPPVSKTHTELTINRTKEDTYPRKSNRQTYPEPFESFWALYPKGHGSKKVSFAEWERLTPEDREEATSGIPVWQKSKRWRDGYVVDCERYLKKRYWENPAPESNEKPLTETEKKFGHYHGV